MSTLASRTASAALTVVGVAVLGIGLWLVAHLGTSGTATFSASPKGVAAVLVGPDVLNRVDAPVTVTARAAGGEAVFIGAAAPADAQAVLASSPYASVTGVDVTDWALTASTGTSTPGTSPAGTSATPALAQSDVWRSSASGGGRTSLVLSQAFAPESLVVGSAHGATSALESVTLEWEHHAWFFQALVVTVVGLLLTLAGAAGLWRSRRPVDAEVRR